MAKGSSHLFTMGMQQGIQELLQKGIVSYSFQPWVQKDSFRVFSKVYDLFTLNNYSYSGIYNYIYYIYI